MARCLALSRTHDAPATDVDDTVRRFLMYVLLPSWAVPALADYRYHKRARIEDTTGLAEARLHTAMMIETGVPVVAALTLRMTRTVFGGMLACAVAHALTSARDVRMAYASPREVCPGEQHVHAFLEVLPWTVIGTLGCLHWQQIRHPLPGARKLAEREPPLPRWYRLTAAAAAIAGVAGPYADEMSRCRRAAAQRRESVGNRRNHS